MTQQTSIDWLVEKLQESGIPLLKDELEMIKQAKEMEKNQSKKDFIAGMEFIPVDPNRYDEDAEQYYNETYRL